MSNNRKPPDVANKEKNEYIPSFISKTPFYLESNDTANDYLDHQRLQKAATDQSIWYDRGKRLGPAATKYRKGACANCGALTHKTKECLSRPRATGARWSGKDIQADEVVQEVELGWDAKRDRWNGYDATEYRAVIEEYEELESLKRKAKEKEAGSGSKEARGGGGEGEPQLGDQPEAEEAKYAEESDMGRHQSTATRNLRLREDTAKYLLNLDLDSARYDPKTRSMVDMGAQTDQAAAVVAEENFMRASGDAAAFERAQKYAWESQERGDKNKTHVQANPTSGEYFLRKTEEERGVKRQTHRQMLLDRYGDAQASQATSLRDMAVVENERFTEYDASGAVKGAAKASTRSKYAEDVFVNNHTSVWGSWWRNFEWGYACCHSVVKNSYCTGDEGRVAFEQAEEMWIGGKLIGVEQEEVTDRDQGRVNGGDGRVEEEEGDQGDIAHVVTEAIAKKRTLAEMKGGVTEHELEAYKRSRAVADDPMAKFLGKDELVH